MMKKKVLFVWLDIGMGHKAPALAVRDSFLECSVDDSSVESMDLLKHVGCHALERKLIKRWNCIIRYPIVSFSLYWLSRLNGGLSRFLLRSIVASSFEKIKSFLLQEKPDVIFSTHYITSIAVEAVRKKYGIKLILINFLADIGDVHPFWITRGVDYYIVSTEEDKINAIRQGIPKRNIRLFNYPIHHNDFKVKRSAKEIRSSMQLDLSRKTLLISFGGFGSIAPDSFIDQVIRTKMPINVIVVTGRNEAQRVRLQNRYQSARTVPVIRILGFVENMSELISISDYCFVKPGPASTREVQAHRKPVLFTRPIAAHEKGNIRYAQERGVGIYVGKSRRKFIRAINDLLYGDLAAKIQGRYRTIDVESGSARIAKFIQSVY